MKKICFVVATLFTAKAFLLDQIAELSRRYDLSLVSNTNDEKPFDHAAVTLIRAPIEREVSPMRDLRALLFLIGVFRNNRFDAVHSVTPKAGLLAMVAAFAARVPVRVHMFTGQVWATKRGMRRFALKMLDRVLAAAATHILVDSPSQRDFLRHEGVLSSEEGEVLAKGSISGVDAGRFRPDAALRAATRTELGVPADAMVFLFVGRLNRDKGVLDLARAFASAGSCRDNTYLLLVGPDEERLGREIEVAAGKAAARLRVIGFTDTPEYFMAASDVFCLPSFREGFGAVVIEAAAAGLPAIGSRIYGLTDAIVENVTGLLIEPGNVAELAASMKKLADDTVLRNALGSAARARALRDFQTALLTSELVRFYERVLPAACRS